MKFCIYANVNEKSKFGFDKDETVKELHLGRLTICAGRFDMDNVLHSLLNTEPETIVKEVPDEVKLEKQKENFQHRIDEIKEETELFRQKLKNRETEVSDLRDKLEEVTDEKDDLSYELNDAHELVDNYRDDVDKLDFELKELKEYVVDIENEREDLDDQNIDFLHECLELESELDVDRA
jgi:chromosome segregation ATPase